MSTRYPVKDIGQDEGVSPEQGMGVAADAAALAPSGSSRSASRAEPPAANAGHTPLPWRQGADLIRIHPHWTDEDGFSTPDNFHRNGNAKTIAAVGKEDGDWRGITQQVADAAFIVRACNSHYELLEALGKAIKWLAITDDPRCTKDLHAAEAAIAKATGQ